MTAPTNTLTSYSAVGNREDLENVIYMIAANKTPFTSNIGKDKADATFHEWQTFSLRTPVGTNKQVQGDDTVVPIHDVLVLDGRLWVRIAADAGPAPAPAPRVTAGDAARLWDPTASGATSRAAESAPSLADGPGGRPADDAAAA